MKTLGTKNLVGLSLLLVSCLVRAEVSHDSAATLISPSGRMRVEADESGSQMINRLLRETWKQKGLKPNGKADDWAFLRRSSLDFLGRLPYPEESQRFFASTGGERRKAWCSYLTEHGDTKAYWARFWADSFDPGRPGSGLSDKIRFGTSNWKSLASKLVETSNPISLKAFLPGERFSGALARTEGESDMLPATDAAAKVLLGISLNCAQCHDHPTETYSQADYWNLNALMRTLPNSTRRPSKISYKDFNSIEKQAAPGYFEKSKEESTGKSLGDLITDDARFPRAIVSQVWGQIFGVGLNAPNLPQDINDASKTINHPKLLQALADRFVKEGHDQAKLQSWICESEAYSLSDADHVDPLAERDFLRMPTKALSGPQFFRIMAGLQRQTNGKLGTLRDRDDEVPEVFSEDVAVKADPHVSSKTVMYLLNSPDLRKHMTEYWKYELQNHPQRTKAEAIQSSAKLFLGRELPSTNLQVLLTHFEGEVTPELMGEVSRLLMASSHFLLNR